MSARRKGKPQQRKQTEQLLKKDELLHQISTWNGLDANLPITSHAHVDHLCKIILEKMEPEQDLLTCGNCQREFLLSDITKFIQHKVSRCNKENIEPFDEHGDLDANDNDDTTSSVISNRRTSISAPIAHKAATEVREKLSPRPSLHPGSNSTPDLPNDRGPVGEDEDDDDDDGEEDEGEEDAHEEENKNNHVTAESTKNDVDASDKKVREDGVTASQKPGRQAPPPPRGETLKDVACATECTEPGTLTCSHCKSHYNSAWSLLQHAQKSHGVKVYHDRETMTPPPKLEPSNKHPSRPSSERPSSQPQSEQRQSNSTTSSHSALSMPKLQPKSPVTRSPSTSSSEIYNQSPPFQVPRQPGSPVAATFGPGPYNRPPFSPEFSHDMMDPFRRFGHFPPLPPGLEHTVPGFPFRPPGFDGSTSLADFYSKKLQQLAGQPNSHNFFNKHVPSFPGQKPSSPFNTPMNNGPSKLTDTAKPVHPTKHKSCEFCPKQFRFQSNLVVHRRMHTGEKPFNCPLCSYACAQASKLKRHMKIHIQAKGLLGGSSALFAGLSSANSENSRHSNSSSPDSKHTQYEDGIDDDNDDEDAESEDGELEEEAMAAREARAEEDIKRIQEQVRKMKHQEQMAEDEEDDELDDEDDEEDMDEGSTDSISNSRKRTASGDKAKDKDNPKDLSLSKQQRAEILSEMMNDTGLSRIAEYKEAYSEALRESGSHGENDVSKEEASKENVSNKIIPGLEPPRPNTRNSCTSSSSRSSNHHSSHVDSPEHKKVKIEPNDILPSPHMNHNHHFPSMDMYPTSPRELFHPGMWVPSPINMRSSGKELMNILAPNERILSNPIRLHENGMHDSAFSPSPKPHHFSPGISTSTPTGSLPGVAMRRRNDTCEFCGKIFRNCSNLTVHRRSHTGEKPYKCELCSYACAQSSKLTRHMKTHGRVGMDVFRCKFCNMPFSVASTLEKHMRRCVEKQQRDGMLGPVAAVSPTSSMASSSASNA